LYKEVRQEGTSVQRVVPIDLSWAAILELCLHHNGPNIHAEIESNDSEKAQLGATTLADVLHVKNKAEAEASDDAEKRRDER
jgi:hypothetical protein